MYISISSYPVRIDKILQPHTFVRVRARVYLVLVHMALKSHQIPLEKSDRLIHVYSSILNLRKCAMRNIKRAQMLKTSL